MVGRDSDDIRIRIQTFDFISGISDTRGGVSDIRFLQYIGIRYFRDLSFDDIFIFFSGDDKNTMIGENLGNTFVSLTDKALSTVQDIRKLFGTTAVTYRPETVSDTPGHN